MGAITAEPMELIGLKQLYIASVQQKHHAQHMHAKHVGVLAFVIILWVYMAMSVERFLLATFCTLYVLFGHRSSPSAVYVIQTEKQRTD